MEASADGGHEGALRVLRARREAGMMSIFFFFLLLFRHDNHGFMNCAVIGGQSMGRFGLSEWMMDVYRYRGTRI